MPLSQTETQRLQRLAQRQTLDTMSGHFGAVAADVAPQVVPVAGGVGSGIAWSTDLVVTAARPGPAPDTTVVTTPSGQQLAATRSVAGPHLPLVAFRAAGLPGAREAMFAPSAGQWVVAVWRRELDHAFVPGHYVGTRPAGCGEQVVEEVHTSLVFSDEMAGGGLFDLDGALLAVVLPCGDRHAALSSSSVSRLLAEGRTFEGQMLARLGLSPAPLSEDLGRHLGVSEGVLVREVWSGYPAAEAGLRGGDVVRELDGEPVASSSDLQPLLRPPGEAGPRLAVRRRGRTVEVELPAREDQRPPDESVSGLGVALEPPPAGFLVGTVAPGSRGDEAGIRPGDRIVGIDGAAPRSVPEVRRVLEGRSPVFVELERRARRFGLLLP